jgi:UDP-2,4-diacetamido-2,4,6-trideoxy-beta-L-altropyranose hydrolase
VATVPELGKCPHDLFRLSGAVQDEAGELGSHLSARCDLLIVDHYVRSADFERACRRFARLVLALDDAPGRTHDCDLLLDATPGRHPFDYRAFVPSRCRLLLGPEYALLRRQFGEARNAALARRQQQREAGRLVVSLGMTDPGNLTSIALDGVRLSRLPLAVDVVLGSGAQHLKQVGDKVAALARSGINARLHVDVAHMASLLSGADLAIGAAGQSSFERCCLGLPSLVVVAAENQRQCAAALAAAGAAESLGDGENLRAQVIADALLSVFTTPERQRQLSTAAAALCDGLGAARVASLCSDETSASRHEPIVTS